MSVDFFPATGKNYKQNQIAEIPKVLGFPNISGQIIATSRDLTPEGSVLEGNSPYFREIWVGEILQFSQNYVQPQFFMLTMELGNLNQIAEIPKSWDFPIYIRIYIYILDMAPSL